MKRRKKFPTQFLTGLKDKVLGQEYELSLVFAGKTLSHHLNATYRGQDKSTDILTFPLSKTSGEIFIDLVTARKEAKKFKMSFTKFVVYLFIHGLLHLKGMRHGDRMEEAEKKLLYGTSNSSGHRHRNF